MLACTRCAARWRHRRSRRACDRLRGHPGLLSAPRRDLPPMTHSPPAPFRLPDRRHCGGTRGSNARSSRVSRVPAGPQRAAASHALQRTLLGLQARLAGEVTLTTRGDLASCRARPRRARRPGWVPQAADSSSTSACCESGWEMGPHRRTAACSPALPRRTARIAATALDRLGIAPLARPVHTAVARRAPARPHRRALANRGGLPWCMDERRPTRLRQPGAPCSRRSRGIKEAARRAGLDAPPEHAFRIATRVLLLANGRAGSRKAPPRPTSLSSALTSLTGRPIRGGPRYPRGGTTRRVCVACPDG